MRFSVESIQAKTGFFGTTLIDVVEKQFEYDRHVTDAINGSKGANGMADAARKPAGNA